MRIVGLVKFMNSIRARLCEKTTDAELRDIAAHVASAVEQVQQACEAQGSTPEELPLPSRRAYLYLKNLDLHAEKKESNKKREDSSRSYSLRGVRPTVMSFLNQLAVAETDSQKKEFVASARVYFKKIEKNIAKNGAQQGDLPVTQQRLLLRLKQYLQPNYMERISANGKLFVQHIEQHWPVSLFQRAIPTVVYLPSDTRLWQLKRERGMLTLYLADIFLLAKEPQELIQVADEILRPRRKRGKRAAFVKQFVHSEVVTLFRQEIEKKVTHRSSDGVGQYCDLNQLFTENNVRFFDGKLCSHGLYWTPNRAKCRTGYFNPLSYEIFISSALDDPDVPEYVVSYVMYHEMLHMVQAEQGAMKPGKRIHTKAFKELERQYPRFDEAEHFLRCLASTKN